MSTSKPMTKPAAARIQKVAARSSKTGGVAKGSFSARATRAAAKNSSN